MQRGAKFTWGQAFALKITLETYARFSPIQSTFP